MIKSITYTVDEYPLLTREILLSLRRKVDAMKTTREDCEFIDHYMTSVGEENLLIECLQDEFVYSFGEIEEILQAPSRRINILEYNYATGSKSYAVTGILLGCLDILHIHLRRGEKIY